MNFKTDSLVETINSMIDHTQGPSDQKIKHCFLETCKHLARLEREIFELKEQAGIEK